MTATFDDVTDFKRRFDTDRWKTLLEKLELSEHHELHRSTAIAHALSRHGVVHEEDAAYYFRYAEAELDEKRTEELLHYELAMIGAGSIDALGKRFVLRL